MEELLASAVRAGIQFDTDGEKLRITAPEGALTDDLRRALSLHKAGIIALLRSGKARTDQVIDTLVPDSANRAEPFPLTDLQHAYWLGRDSMVEMGNVGAHLYMELDCKGADLLRLNDAFCRLIERHDMLRAVVGRDGMQRILPTVPRYQIEVNDQSGAPQADAERAAEATREVLSHQLLKPDQWPLFDIRATAMPQGRARLHISLDLLIFDSASLYIFFREWHQLYAQPELTLPPIGLSFRDYVLADRGLQSGAAYLQAHDYWMAKVDGLPASPDLPLRSDPAARQAPHFSRRQARLEKARWEKLKASARERGLTPSSLLLALYSEVLARWSATPHFTVNVAVANRFAIHPDVNKLLGDFTSPILHEVDRRDPGLGFAEFAQRLQPRLLEDLEHREVSGVVVLREWSKRRGIALQATMPVVFSSALAWSGGDNIGDFEQFGANVYCISQTPQVWLDHHVVEANGDLMFNWDAVDAVFEDGVLDAMFFAYCDALDRLTHDDSLWESRDIVALPPAMQQRREDANRTEHAVPQRRLHAGFIKQATNHPEAPAIFSPARTMCYGELLGESVAVADWLSGQGVQPGKPVAVLMHKGWEQVVAVYGVLLAGAAYMPLDADLPAKRLLELLHIGEIRQVITQPGALRAEVAAAGFDVLEVRPGMVGEFGASHQHSLEASLDELAYVIFTSGTTGVPKGVMIDHRGAVNTIEHINRLCSVGPQDRVLAVSSLSFDLSVYDIFGLLDAGGALVIPDHSKGHDPLHWRDLLVRHGVTLWNSAPQLMQMQMDSFRGEDRDTAPLRMVLLSGDFIPLDLPDRIRHRYHTAKVISLGGATEASIWSIYYPVGKINPAWKSIPYGRPLPNQTIWVADSAMRPCPDHVRGRIFIGGIGLAKGYWRDDEKTAARFMTHPVTSERLYDTGDLGLYAPDGNVLILGRDDGQVKIRGFRVELGEIEATLNKHPDVLQSVVLATAGAARSRQLAAFVEVASPVLSEQALKTYLADRLPDYMVPAHLVRLDGMPVSSNGKIDYRALLAMLEQVGDEDHNLVLPRNETEQVILSAWSRVIVGTEIGVTDNFFELGGDSIMATQLVREINTVLPQFQLEMHELFENLTIEELAALFRERAGSEEHGLEVEADGQSQQALPIDGVMADVHTGLLALSNFDFSRAHDTQGQAPHAVLVTGATGWIGAHVVAELLSRTQAKIYCLVRGHDGEQARSRVWAVMRGFGIVVEPQWAGRVEPICGDLAQPLLGLDPLLWQQLSQSVDAIYHLGASLNVLADYRSHRDVNVNSMVDVIRLATETHLKPVFFASPMAVCKRYKSGELTVLTGETGHADPDGLLTAYAQSKWAAERLLLAAIEKGLPARIYRTSHALPSAGSGSSKRNDTYGTALQVACAAGVVPEWKDSALNGVPVDVLGRLIVDCSMDRNDHRGVVHIENRRPPDLTSLLATLLCDRTDAGGIVYVSLEEWKARCLEAAAGLPSADTGLARALFAERANGAAVEHMFSNHLMATDYFERTGKTDVLSNLTTEDYWRAVYRNAGWQTAHQ